MFLDLFAHLCIVRSSRVKVLIFNARNIIQDGVECTILVGGGDNAGNLFGILTSVIMIIGMMLIAKLTQLQVGVR